MLVSQLVELDQSFQLPYFTKFLAMQSRKGISASRKSSCGKWLTFLTKTDFALRNFLNRRSQK